MPNDLPLIDKNMLDKYSFITKFGFVVVILPRKYLLSSENQKRSKEVCGQTIPLHSIVEIGKKPTYEELSWKNLK